jgi:alkaline phosphatase
MNNPHRFRSLAIAIFAVAAFFSTSATSSSSAAPKNVIFVIGDGMGFEHLKAASLYQHGEEGQLFLQNIPVRGKCTTRPANGRQTTDSAAAGTAMACGVKVNNGVIAIRQPGDGSDLPTMLERFAEQGKATGLVTTDSIGGATPASFAAHTNYRKKYDEIFDDYFHRTRPTLVMGGGWKLPKGLPEKTGYHLITNRDELKRLAEISPMLVCGVFCPESLPYEWEFEQGQDKRYDTIPHLTETTEAALEYLGRNERGFFVLIEGARIDHASHKNHLENMVYETIELDRAIRTLFRWAQGRTDTLIVVTADHECGGLKVLKGNGKGKMPEAAWSSQGHTSAAVPVMAWGVGAKRFAGEMDNTEFRAKIFDLPATENSIDNSVFKHLPTVDN